jgi:hypothetical protein
LSRARPGSWSGKVDFGWGVQATVGVARERMRLVAR